MDEHNDKEPVERDLRGHWRCLYWTVLYGFLVVFFIFTVNKIINTPVCSWASRARGTLRSIGASQLAYQETNDGKFYGSFNALRKDMYIAEGYTLGNLIGNYSVSWQVHNVSTVMTEDLDVLQINTFTVIAFPRDIRRLETFAITEDQVVRIFNKRNRNDPDNVYTWDPIL